MTAIATLVTFDSAYVDLNFTACAVMCGTAGLMWDEKGTYWYVGTGLGAGGGLTLSLGPGQSVSPGLNCGVSASAPGAAVQWGMDLQGLMAVAMVHLTTTSTRVESRSARLLRSAIRATWLRSSSALG